MELPMYTKQWHNDVYPDIDASNFSVKGKRLVITGAAGGIGAATVEAFARAGAAEIFALGRTEKTLSATKAAVSSKHANTKIVTVVTDIGNADSVAAAFTQIASKGPIDIFINNAAYLSIGDVATADPVEWFKVFETNIKGSLLLIQAVLKHISANEGIIINVTSAAGHVPFVPMYSAYATSKIASAKLFEYVHHEHPELKVFNLQPGIIESTALASKATAESGLSFPQQDTVELPANFMVWLCSPEAGFLRGRFLWANWDVKELIAKKETLEADPTLLTVGLLGWPQ